MSIDHATQPNIRPPLPSGRPETWVYSNEWPMPREGRLAVDRECREHPFHGQELRWLEKGIKFHHLFPSLWVAVKRTSRGLAVLMAGDLESPEFATFRDSLAPEDLSEVLTIFVEDPYQPAVTAL